MTAAATPSDGIRLLGAEPPRLSVKGAVAYALFLISVTAYTCIRLFVTLPTTPCAAAVSLLLLMGELLLAARTLIYGTFIIKNKRNYTNVEDLMAANSYSFHVRVIVPCYNEGLEIIQQTVMAAAQALLPPGCKKSIYLCDDGRDPGKKGWVESIASVLPSTPGYYVDSVHYVSDRPRSPNEGNGKSNNMNHALQTVIYPGMQAADISDNEIIAVLDADMVALPHIYTTLLPYLTQPDIAIVQSPQNWYNYDPYSDVLDHSAKLKWHVAIPQTVNGWCGICCMGSNFVLRAKALATVGWWPTWTVVEDQGLAQELKRAGFNAYFIEEVLAVGEVPTGVKDKYIQYSRLIKGYLTNWLSLKHGAFWDTSKIMFARIAANKLHRDLLCGFYVPLLLAIPPIAILADVPLLEFVAPNSLMAWLAACVAFWGLNQVVLQFLSLERSAAGPFRNARGACDIGANWLSSLFGSMLYWDKLLAAIPAVVKAELTGTHIAFNCTPKSVRATLELARSLSRAMFDSFTGALRVGSGTGRSLSQMRALDALRKAHFAFESGEEHLISTAVCSENSRPVKQPQCKPSSTVAIAACAPAGDIVDASVNITDPISRISEAKKRVQQPEPASKLGTQAAAGSKVSSNQSNQLVLPKVIDPLTKPYKRAGPEPFFPWQVLKLHVMMLLLSLAGAAKGLFAVTTSIASNPQELILTGWCLHNAVPLLLLMYRTIAGDTVELAQACRLTPKVFLAAGGVVLGALLYQAPY